ncbi:MAG: alpha/beta fold hydrolase [Hyphomicrobiales bacterium]|nr:alpha/beta fold hydrolase [Hyphomicrobiales bacterium]
MTSLHVSRSSGHNTGPPIVLLHGFGSDHRVWRDVRPHLESDRPVLAFDLPGHGRSLGRSEAGNAHVAAKAVLQCLAEMDIEAAHLAGHSMGGAAAALIALMAPERVRSLTLLAPGAFGPEVNHRLLRRFAAAAEEAEIALLLEQFFGWQNPLPAGLAAELAETRRVDGQLAALEGIVETLFNGDVQKILPVEKLAGGRFPVKVVWGTQDRVLPTRQAHKLPGRIAVHIFENAGHMLPYEIPGDVAHLIAENAR